MAEPPDIPPDPGNALQLLLEDRPMTSNQSCLAGLTDAVYSYYRSYVQPLIDYDKYKDTNWEIEYDALSEMEYVGAGAFGKVYSAKLDGEVVAVKIPEDKRETDMTYLRELRHENIVRFRGVCTKDSNNLIIMEYCQYGSLYNYLHNGTRVMINRTFDWAKQVAHAMEYLHRKNIIHRDLKSPNILIADNLVCKVSDFGTSRKWEQLSMQMSTRGTTYWMAPELMLGSKCSDKVDVWSYGVVLWELLTQEVPYENLHPCAVTYGVGRKKISLPLPSTFPLHLRILLSHCWSRDPRNRPPFTRIIEVLSLAWQQWGWLGDELYMTMQDSWRQEVDVCKNNGWPTSLARVSDVLTLAWNHSDFLGADLWRQRLQMAKEIGWQMVPYHGVTLDQPHKQNKTLYKKVMREASKMYMDACALYLRLEQREATLVERELAFGMLNNPRSWLARRRVSTSSSTSYSPGQLTVVKLQQSINNKVRAVTEIAESGTLPNEVSRKNKDKRRNKDLLPLVHDSARASRELARQQDRLRIHLPYEVARKIEQMSRRIDESENSKYTERKANDKQKSDDSKYESDDSEVGVIMEAPQRKSNDSRKKSEDSEAEAEESTSKSDSGRKSSTDDVNGNVDKVNTVVTCHVENVKDSHNNDGPVAV